MTLRIPNVLLMLNKISLHWRRSGIHGWHLHLWMLQFVFHKFCLLRYPLEKSLVSYFHNYSQFSPERVLNHWSSVRPWLRSPPLNGFLVAIKRNLCCFFIELLEDVHNYLPKLLCWKQFWGRTVQTPLNEETVNELNSVDSLFFYDDNLSEYRWLIPLCLWCNYLDIFFLVHDFTIWFFLIIT